MATPLPETAASLPGPQVGDSAWLVPMAAHPSDTGIHSVKDGRRNSRLLSDYLSWPHVVQADLVLTM